MGVSVAAPPPRDYAQETRDTLQAQIDLAPQKFAAESQYAPQYQQLNIDLARKAAPELMGIYESIAPRLSAQEAASRTASRAGDIADIESLGPRAREAIRAASPEQAALADTMTRQATSALAAGSRLTPEQQRAVEQQTRAGLSARGLAGSGGGAVQEVVRSQLAGAGLQQQRQQQAMQALGASQGVYGDVFQQVLGRPSQAFGMLPGVSGQAQGFGPGQLFNPESQYAADIYGANQQSALAASTASAANRSALIGGAIQGLTSL